MQNLNLTTRATEYVLNQLDGLQLDQCWDSHGHHLGAGDLSESGIFLKRDSGFKGIQQDIRLAVFKHATKSRAAPTDLSYLKFYTSCAENMFPGFKALAFSFAPFHHEDGTPNLSLSDFVIPNEWGLKASQLSSSLAYVASVHPNSLNALSQLRQAKRDGAVAIKWLPCAHNINPSDIRYIPFYEELRTLRLPLITHAGAEHAVEGAEFVQAYGNPLHLRLPLAVGATIIVAHCATTGYDLDFDNGDKKVPSFELFARLMNDPSFENNLFADISATPQINRAHWIPRLLENEEWHPRLLNGSDFPLPAIPLLFSLRWLQFKGLLKSSDVAPLNELRQKNPLLFDFVLKRAMSFKGAKFSNQVFETKRVFAS